MLPRIVLSILILLALVLLAATLPACDLDPGLAITDEPDASQGIGTSPEPHPDVEAHGKLCLPTAPVDPWCIKQWYCCWGDIIPKPCCEIDSNVGISYPGAP